MKIALASQVSSNNIEDNFKLIRKSIEKLKDQVDLICFGEAFLHGFNALSWNYLIDKKIAISIDTNYIKNIQYLAKHNETAVSFGFYELFADNIFCSNIFINKNGEILNHYRRISSGWKVVSKCDEHYKEGSEFSTFNFMGK